eukprot:scaffold1982_cov93-Amphora_coffeaeformis.AAC.58
MGTLCGAVLGLAVGFLSILVADAASRDGHDDEYLKAQAIFLALAIPIVVFIGAFLATQAGYRGSYVSTLTNLTTGLVVLAFFGVDEGQADGRPPWMHGLFRVLNILIGCAIAGSVTSLVRPVATHQQLEGKVRKLSNLTGGSVRAVLDASIAISKGRNDPEYSTKLYLDKEGSMESAEKRLDRAFLPTITDIVRDPENNISDQAHDSYIASVDLWRECRQTLQLLHYDPVFRSKFSKAQQRRFREHMRLRLARLFRIQVVVVMMDSLLRGGLHRGFIRHDSTEGYDDELEAIGMHIEFLLDTSHTNAERNQMARKLIQEDIGKVRKRAQEVHFSSSSAALSAATSFSSSSSTETDTAFDGECEGLELWNILGTFDHPFPLAKLEGPAHSSLFYRLLEHTILKAVRLYHVNESFAKELDS